MSNELFLDRAIDLIDEFCRLEYGGHSEWSDLKSIPLAYTNDEDGNEIQVSVDLENYIMIYEHEGKETYQDHFDSLEELIYTQLCWLDFDELVSTY